jgi:hypothetical protein
MKILKKIGKLIVGMILVVSFSLILVYISIRVDPILQNTPSFTTAATNSFSKQGSIDSLRAKFGKTKSFLQVLKDKHY